MLANHEVTETSVNEMALRRRVENFLQSRGVDSQRLQVDVRGSTVILSGRLPSLRVQEVCEGCCRRVPGVRDVISEVDVPLPLV